MKHSGVIITRPPREAQHLAGELRLKNIATLVYPVIEIAPINPVTPADSQWQEYTLAIAISRYSAEFACAWLRKTALKLSENLKWYAVGKGTADCLREFDIEAAYPEDPLHYNSEGLLAMSALQELQGQKAIIFRGRGGRDVLRQGLIERGANADYLEVYERRIPESHQDLAEAISNRPEIHWALLITSVEGLENFIQLNQKSLAHFLNMPMMVLSERIAQAAVASGFRRERVGIVKTAGVSDIEVELASRFC